MIALLGRAVPVLLDIGVAFIKVAGRSGFPISMRHHNDRAPKTVHAVDPEYGAIANLTHGIVPFCRIDE